MLLVLVLLCLRFALANAAMVEIPKLYFIEIRLIEKHKEHERLYEESVTNGFHSIRFEQ